MTRIDRSARRTAHWAVAGLLLATPALASPPQASGSTRRPARPFVPGLTAVADGGEATDPGQSGTAGGAGATTRVEELTLLYEIADLVDDALTATPGSPSADDVEKPRWNVDLRQLVHRERRRERALELVGQLVDQMRLFCPADLKGLHVEVVDPMRQLLVRGTREMHDWVASFLAAQRRPVRAVELRCRYVELPLGSLRALGITQTSAAFEDETAAREFEQRLLAVPGAETVLSPTLAAKPRSPSVISILDQVAYVKDWSLRVVQPGNQEVADPEVAVVKHGIEIGVTATPLPGDLWGVDLKFERYDLVQPMRTRSFRLSPAYPEEVTVSMPELITKRVLSLSSLPSGAAAIVTALNQEGSRELCIYYQLRTL